MNPALLTLATHLPAVAWARQPHDHAVAALHALLPAPVGVSVAPGATASSTAAPPSAIPPSAIPPTPPAATAVSLAQFIADLASTPAPATGALLTALSGAARALAAHPATATVPAAEVLALVPITPGDVSALPVHDGARAFAATSHGALYLRDPHTRTAVLVDVDPGSSGTAQWRVALLDDAPMAPQAEPLGAAAVALSDAVHQAAAVIAAARRAAGHPRPPLDLASAATDSAAARLPGALEPREAELLHRAEMIEQIRRVANATEVLTGAGSAQQPQLWALQVAINAARRAAFAGYAQRLWQRASAAQRSRRHSMSAAVDTP